MLNGKFVVDATVHPFDYSEENWGDGYKQVIGGITTIGCTTRWSSPVGPTTCCDKTSSLVTSTPMP